MGSTQSTPCPYKSSKVTSMEVVYKKKESELSVTQVPNYDLIKMDSRIKNCNGERACGDPNYMAAVCHKPNGGALIEAPFVAWNHILKRYACMPCCILEDNKHSKMPLCSSIPSEKDVTSHSHKHGRCGIEFNP